MSTGWHKLLTIYGVTVIIMNIADIRNRWNQVRGRLKQRYCVLTDEDLVLYLGREGDLMVRLQKKLGKTKADILKIIGEA